MGIGIFYCTQCGVRASGSDFESGQSPFRDSRLYCAFCLGIPVSSLPRSLRESSKRIRKPSSTTPAVARPCVAEKERARIPRPILLGGLSVLGAVLFAIVRLSTPGPAIERPDAPVVPAPPPPPPRPDPVAASVPPPDQGKLPAPIEELREKPLRPPAAVPVDPELEARAEECYDAVQEAASALADEGRFEDALARIRAFPEEFRRCRAWLNLEGLKRQIEARGRAR